jgi:hypothetical protein
MSRDFDTKIIAEQSAELDRLRATNAALEKALAEYRAAVSTDDVIWPEVPPERQNGK